MASDIMAKAAIATNDADLQTQLGLKAFLQAVPRNIGRELRRRHFNSVKEALDEARFLQSVEEDEDRESGKIFTVEAEAKPPVEEPKVDIQQIVEACMKQIQAQQPKKQQSERPRSSRRKLRCWCCGEEGHTMRACPVFSRIKLLTASRRLKSRGCKMMQKGARGVPDGTDDAESASGCQMVPESAKGCQRVPEGASQMVPDGARG